MQPYVPHDILPVLTVLLIQGKESLSHVAVKDIIQFPALVFFAEDRDFFESSLLIQGNTPVVEQIVIEDLVQPSLCQKETHMLLKLLASQEGTLQPFHDLLLLCAEGIRICRVNGGEIGIFQFVLFPLQQDRAFLIIDPVEKRPVFHIKALLSLYDLTFHLELDHRDRLVDAKVHLCLLRIRLIRSLQFKAGARIIFVYLERKRRKREQVDPVSVLKDIQIPVARADPNHIRDTSSLPCRCSHPQNIMVPPLDIQGMIPHQFVHDDMRTRPSVKDISHNMKMIHHKSLDQFGDGLDKLFRAFDPDDR